MKSLAIYNNKGGVGKTTSVINIAYQLALADKKVLVVDLDGQGNASRFFTDEPKDGLAQALVKPVVTPEVARCETRYPNIDIITSTQELNNISAQFEQFPPETRSAIAHKIVGYSKEPWYAVDYDYILVDLPPALNCLTESIVSACDYVFVPIELGLFAIQGIPNVTGIISSCGTKFGGCFVNKFDRENPADLELLELLKTTLGDKTMKNYLPFSRVIKNSISFRMAASEYMEWTFAAECYAKLTREIVEICGQ